MDESKRFCAALAVITKGGNREAAIKIAKMRNLSAMSENAISAAIQFPVASHGIINLFRETNEADWMSGEIRF